MANVNAPQGFKLIKSWNKPPVVMVGLASYGTALGVGDPIVKAGSSDANGIPSVELASAGSSGIIDGVITGILASSPDGLSGGLLNTDVPYRPASTLRYLQVCTDPQAEYEIQANAAFTAADIGLNADYATGTPSSVFGNSTAVLDASSKGTGETLQCHIERLADGEEFGTYNKVVVTINTHRNNGQTAGV